MTTMFLFKKLLGDLLLPLPVSLLLVAAGLVLALFKRPRFACTALAVGALIPVSLGYRPVSQAITAPLEHRYPPLVTIPRGGPPIKWVVVLGGGIVCDPSLPGRDQLSRDSLVRLLEGIRLYRQLPGAALLVSGGDRCGEARPMAETAELLGVNPADVALDAQSPDTETEAAVIKPMIGRDRFILVTSAVHMPRSIGLFERKGMHPIPAPTAYTARRTTEPRVYEMIYPYAENLLAASNAFHEYYGIVWAKLQGRM